MREVLERLARGEMTVDEAEKALRVDIVEKVDDVARLDISRTVRRGVPEIVLAEGKSNEDLTSICGSMLNKNGRAIMSRVSDPQLFALKENFSDKYRFSEYVHSRCVVLKRQDSEVTQTGGKVGILTAGTADLGVAEEAAMIAEEMGCKVYLEADAGVAGIHRLVEPLSKMIQNDVDTLIVAAGREGALPTVVAGLVDLPIIAVPTSSGYGYGGHGQAALMAMLQACSLGLAVVNIDAGIAAGVIAAQISNRVAKARNTQIR